MDAHARLRQQANTTDPSAHASAKRKGGSQMLPPQKANSKNRPSFRDDANGSGLRPAR
jgi:hypothetical protein